MRLFLAIDLPREVKESLVERARMPGHRWPNVRWVRPATIHLTLAFLGEVDSGLIPEIGLAVGEICSRYAKRPARLGRGGFFASRGKARVLWVSLDAGDDLPDLHRDIETGLAAIEVDGGPIYAPEARPFRPHVTLGRCREPWPRSAAEEWCTAFGDARLGFEVSRLTLFQSHLTSSGPRYEALSSHLFASV